MELENSFINNAKRTLLFILYVNSEWKLRWFIKKIQYCCNLHGNKNLHEYHVDTSTQSSDKKLQIPYNKYLYLYRVRILDTFNTFDNLNLQPCSLYIPVKATRLPRSMPNADQYRSKLLHWSEMPLNAYRFLSGIDRHWDKLIGIYRVQVVKGQRPWNVKIQCDWVCLLQVLLSFPWKHIM